MYFVYLKEYIKVYVFAHWTHLVKYVKMVSF